MRTARIIVQDLRRMLYKAASTIGSPDNYWLNMYLSSLNARERVELKAALFMLLGSKSALDLHLAVYIIRTEYFQDMIPGIKRIFYDFKRTQPGYHKFLEVLLALGDEDVLPDAIAFLEMCNVPDIYNKILSYTMVIKSAEYIRHSVELFKYHLEQDISVPDLSSMLLDFYKYAEEVKMISVFYEMKKQLLLMKEHEDKIRRAMRFIRTAIKPSGVPEYMHAN